MHTNGVSNGHDIESIAALKAVIEKHTAIGNTNDAFLKTAKEALALLITSVVTLVGEDSAQLLAGTPPAGQPLGTPMISDAAMRQPAKKRLTLKEKRIQTKARLGEYSLTEPLPLERGHAALVRGHYLKAKGGGYVRTAKEYSV